MDKLLRGKRLRRKARHLGPIVVVAVVGLLGSWGAWYAAARADEERVRGVLELRAEWRAKDLERKLQQFVSSVEALGALVSAQERVDLELVRRFTVEAHQPADPTRRLGWAPRVLRAPDGDLRVFADGAMRIPPIVEQGPGGEFVPRAPRPEHVPVVLETVFTPAVSLLGLDLLARNDYRSGFERARDEGRVTSSPPVIFPKAHQLGFFVFAPVYLGGQVPDTVEERRARLRGFAFGTFLVQKTLEAALEGMPEIVETIRFVVPTASANPVAEYRPGQGIVSPGADSAPPGRSDLMRSFDVLGQTWSLQFDFPPAVANALRSLAPLVWLLAGLTATSTLLLFLVRERSRTLRMKSEVRARTADLRQANTRLDAALANMSHGLAMFDADRKLVVCNDRYAEVYGLPRGLIRPGMSQQEVLEHRAAAGAYTGPDAEGYIRDRVAVAAEAQSGTSTLHLRSGRVITVSHQPMPGGGWVSTHEDITERRRIEARIEHMARHDALTELPNRVKFRESLEGALRRVRRGERVALLYLDLDRFKAVNDTLGHPTGDAVLCGVADRLRACIGPSDCVGRIGGDEFAIVQVGIAEPGDAGALAERVLQALNESYVLDGQNLFLGASVGVAVAPEDGDTPDQLLRNADVALYRAKADGRGTYRFFEPGMDAHLHARRALELELRQALAEKQFEIFYQPLVDLERNEVSGFEALLRWRHPHRGMISPAEFIPSAEETGIIVPLGEWVLREACREAASWPAHVKVAVNLSPVQLRTRSFPELVVSALASAGLLPSRLELEVTESVLLEESDAFRITMHQLRGLGVRIALDDFGTGYSSLSYLRSFPFDKIKIDRSFVAELLQGTESPAIVGAITSLASSLGMGTTAEGVETPEQLERLRAMGCSEAQGYLFSAPKPSAEIARLIGELTRRMKVAA